MSRVSDGSREPTMRDRFVGAAIASPAIGLIVCLFLLLEASEPDPEFALLAGFAALGVAGAVLYTFGVLASTLIDAAMGHRATASIGAHVVVGAAAGYVVIAILFDTGDREFGIVLGAVAAGIAAATARRGPDGPWTIPTSIVVIAATLVSLMWQMTW